MKCLCLSVKDKAFKMMERVEFREMDRHRNCSNRRYSVDRQVQLNEGTTTKSTRNMPRFVQFRLHDPSDFFQVTSYDQKKNV